MGAAISKDEPEDEKEIDGQPTVMDAGPLSTAAEELFSVRNILNDFIQFLPIYSLSNFMRSFPEYDYGEFDIMKEVYKSEAWMNYKLYWESWQTTPREEVCHLSKSIWSDRSE